MRAWLVALAVLGAILAGGIALAGSFALLRDSLGVLPALIAIVLIGALGVAGFRPAWFALRTWTGVPRLETCRRDLLGAIAALPGTTDGVTLAECMIGVCEPLLPGRALAVLLQEPRAERFTPAAIGGRNAGDLKSLALPRRSALARALERDARPLVVTRWVEGPDGRETPGESDTVLPMCERGNLVGVLVVGRDPRGRGLTRDQTLIAQELCNQSAGAIESAQLYSTLRGAFSELETAQRELLAIQRATTAAQSSLNLQEVLRNICNGLIEGMDYQEAIVYLVDPLTKGISPASAAGRLLTPKLRVRALGEDARPPRLDFNSPALRALMKQEILISDNPMESVLPYLVESEAISRSELARQRRVVNVPLVANGDVVGGMALLTERQTFVERELDSLRGFAAQAASAIVNARLYEDLRDAYDDIRIAQDELVRTERMRTLGELASSVAHDFNNILLAILTHTQIALRDLQAPSLKHALEVIEQAAMDGSEVVRRVQNLARTKSPDLREPVDLSVIVRQSLEIAQPVITAAAEGRGVTLTMELESGPASRMTGTSSELREVFVNLMMNAAHAMPQGGALSLRTFVKDGHVWGEVADTGTGMTAEVKRRVFEPFFTTKGSAGSGLGMSIVASIVQRHAGIIEIDTAVGRGTTISVGFPLTMAAELTREPPGSRRVQVREAIKVLIVDDDSRVCEALTLALEHLGHSAFATGDSQEALRVFLDGDYSVVFTDLTLGRVSGWDIAQAVKKMRHTAEVVLVTGWAAQLDVPDPAARGVDQILAKPFTLDEVAAVLDRVRLRQAATA